MKGYNIAREIYADIGVDTEAAIKKLARIAISVNCWQGDDVRGFLFANNELSGGICTTGNYFGAAKNADELRSDLDVALSCIPGTHKLNLHSTYADTNKAVDLDALEPCHYESWVAWANERGMGLDFNPTCFSHKMADSGFTASSADKSIRDFWIEHCKRCRKIGEYFGKSTNQACVTNFWFPDGYKDTPVDRLAPRVRLSSALDEIFAEKIDKRYNIDAIESKLFGIGSESYTVGSNEFCMGYATKNNIAVCLDSGHFHPTEVISDKISSVLLFTEELLLHVSRPVRWDSDHVVVLDNELIQIAHAIVRSRAESRVHIGLDYFDASINRLAAWIIGTRNMQKALLIAYLEPTDKLMLLESSGDYTARLALGEELLSLPYSIVWDEFCERMNVPVRTEWTKIIKDYERTVLCNR